MRILVNSNTKDSGACLLIDGELVAAVNEERLNRNKMTRAFPEKSIEWLLNSHGLSAHDIDAISIGAWKAINSTIELKRYLKIAKEMIYKNPGTRDAIESRIKGSINSDTKQWTEFKKGLESKCFSKHRFFHCQHQMAHSYTAFEFSPYERALVVSLDGRGDFMSGSVSIWRKGQKPFVLRNELELDSLGLLYGLITYYLGFTPDRHEGKIMGLAARGNPEVCLELMRKMVVEKEGCIISNIGEYYAPYIKAELPKLRSILSRFKREDIAAAIQKHLEETVVAYISHYLTQTGEKNLCVAGGVFANVLLNMCLRELPEVENLFVFPHMGDGGISVGGAAYAASQLGDKVKPMKNAYLGPSNDINTYIDFIINSGFKITEPSDFPSKVALLIHKGYVVGFYCGRMEYGPRALGARSILARATDPTINSELNRRLNRTEFMPFSPVTLEEAAEKCYQGWKKEDVSSYYMTSCYNATELMKKQSPAAIHIDGTARPQIINSFIHKEYYAVLKAYNSMSNIPSIINTSFNLHEEPIACDIEQALDVLKYSGVDALAIPPLIIYKS